MNFIKEVKKVGVSIRHDPNLKGKSKKTVEVSISLEQKLKGRLSEGNREVSSQ